MIYLKPCDDHKFMIYHYALIMVTHYDPQPILVHKHTLRILTIRHAHKHVIYKYICIMHINYHIYKIVMQINYDTHKIVIYNYTNITFLIYDDRKIIFYKYTSVMFANYDAYTIVI